MFPLLLLLPVSEVFTPLTDLLCIALLCFQPALAGIIELRRVYHFLIATLVCLVMNQEQECTINQFPTRDVLERGSERTEQAFAIAVP
jgi:hypothetical protein